MFDNKKCTKRHIYTSFISGGYHCFGATVRENYKMRIHLCNFQMIIMLIHASWNLATHATHATTVSYFQY
ncbi:hypothetical protein RIR_jg32786.t1 [Rhizophagus irregularis DAOM 181602=DAOM 197198]|nr:hypothetical protein RIR_jg32786.t1 [Rhizophagus irregularis DAOM 181602=DAOM 197198]